MMHHQPGTEPLPTMRGVAPLHAAVVTPKSRAVFARENGELPDDSIQFSLEGGKFFPETSGGLADPLAPTDIVNRAPPRDGHIASGDVETHPIMPIPAAAVLNEPGAERWPKHDVKAGQELETIWSFHARHKSRRWKAFITRAGWNPEAPLSRAQFDLTPLPGGVEYQQQPFWDHDDMTPDSPFRVSFALPDGYTGYHVLLIAWEVADTANAFYQVIDLNFA